MNQRPTARPTAIVCLTGSELTRGETRDSNGTYLASQLTQIGVDVRELRLAPDDPALLATTFRECTERSNIVVVSGGLGPTADDHTVRVVAEVFDRSVVLDPTARERMHEIALQRLGDASKIPANFYKQAEVVTGAEVLPNPVGLAPGCLVETARGFLATLPGVPRELRALFRQELLPRILERFSLTPPRIWRAKIFDVPESHAEARIQALGFDFDRIDYGISARPGELLVKFVASDPACFAQIDEVDARLREEFGELLVPLPEGVVDEHGEAIAIEHVRLVHDLLLETGATVATAESCTGGLVARRLTDTAGSSAYFLGGIVAYQDDVKIAQLGVDRQLLEDHGAVSEPVCRAMATGARERFGADYGIGVTGIAGPGGGSPEKPVGLVYIGLARSTPGGSEIGIGVDVERRVFRGSRDLVRQQSSTRALELLRRALRRTTSA